MVLYEQGWHREDSSLQSRGKLYLCLTLCDTRCLLLQAPSRLALDPPRGVAQLPVRVVCVPCQSLRSGHGPALCAGALGRAVGSSPEGGVGGAGWASPPTLLPRGGSCPGWAPPALPTLFHCSQAANGSNHLH